MTLAKQTLLGAALSLLFCCPALASLTNGGFDNGLNGWTTLGDVGVQSGMAYLTNASATLEDDYPAVAGAFNHSGTSAESAGVPGGLDAFSGLAIDGLDDTPNQRFAFEGSALKQSFVAPAGMVLKFDWQFFTNEAANPDYAYVALNGNKVVLASAGAATAPSTGAFRFETALTTAYLTLVEGLNTVAFGVVDIDDITVTSALKLDNVQAVPLPPASLLLGPALFGLLGSSFRRRQNP
jgi:hypothetical protein